MDAPSNSSQPNPSLRIICRVCENEFPKYTCHRCNMRYCSSQCYKSHSPQCNEFFGGRDVLNELYEQFHLQPVNEPQKLMLDIITQQIMAQGLAAPHSDSKPFSSGKAAEQILSGIPLNVDDLNLEGQKRLKLFITPGEQSKSIQPWEPWWLRPSAKDLSLSHDGTRLVQPHNSNDTEGMSSQPEIDDIPPGPEAPLQSSRQLREGEPSPHLAVHLIDIIYSYCFTLRLYNEHWKSDFLGACHDLATVSSVLFGGELPETVSKALSRCFEQTCTQDFKHVGEAPSGLLPMDDVVSILNLGGAAIICLLTDLQRMIEAVEEDFKSEKSYEEEVMAVKENLYFIMCWANEQPKEAWDSLALTVKAEKPSKAEGKPLIREVK